MLLVAFSHKAICSVTITTFEIGLKDRLLRLWHGNSWQHVENLTPAPGNKKLTTYPV